MPEPRTRAHRVAVGGEEREFFYEEPGVGDDPFDFTPRYRGPGSSGDAVGREFGVARLAAGFAAAGLRREVWPVPPWVGLRRRRVLPPLPKGTNDPAEFSDRLGHAVAMAIGDADTVGVTVSGGVDSAALLWLAARWCRAHDRRLVVVTLDLRDDHGGSPAVAARRIVDVLGLDVDVLVVDADPHRWPEPPWCWHGPRFDAWPRYRSGIAETAASANAKVLLHGTGADELLTAPAHLLGAVVRDRGVAAGRDYLRQCRELRGESEFDHVLSVLMGRLRGSRTAGVYWALTWPGLAQDEGPPTLTPAGRDVAVAWAREHRQESLHACVAQRATWAQGAALHALFPRDLLTPAGGIAERFPLLDHDFARYAYHLPLVSRLGHHHVSAYLNHKHLLAQLLPGPVAAVLPPKRLRAYTSYARYWSAMPADTSLAIEAGLVTPDWEDRCRDAFDRAIVLSVETWMRGALATGATASTTVDTLCTN